MKDSVDGSTAGVVLNFMKNGRIFFVTEFYDNGNAITNWLEKDGSRTLSNKDMKSSAALFTGNRLSITKIQNYLFNVKGKDRSKRKYSIDEGVPEELTVKAEKTFGRKKVRRLLPRLLPLTERHTLKQLF